jgi:hypothetical protein
MMNGNGCATCRKASRRKRLRAPRLVQPAKGQLLLLPRHPPEPVDVVMRHAPRALAPRIGYR